MEGQTEVNVWEDDQVLILMFLPDRQGLAWLKASLLFYPLSAEMISFSWSLWLCHMCHIYREL